MTQKGRVRTTVQDEIFGVFVVLSLTPKVEGSTGYYYFKMGHFVFLSILCFINLVYLNLRTTIRRVDRIGSSVIERSDLKRRCLGSDGKTNCLMETRLPEDVGRRMGT